MKLNASISEDGFGRAIVIATDGKISGEIRGLRGARVRQLLSKLKITTSPDSEGYMIPIAVLRDMVLNGNFTTIRKGQTYKYSKEDIVRFAEQGLTGADAIHGRRTIDGVPEPVVADVEYVATEDGFRCMDIRGITIELPERIEGWLIDGKFKYIKPAKANNSIKDLAAELNIQ